MEATLALPLLVALIAVALAFDFLNGMNDAANAIATVVSTRVLRPQYAVVWAAFFNFVAFLVFGLHVAETIGRGIVQADIVTARVIFGALTGAIVWQIVTNRLGIPSSSSHALIGGLVGAGMAKAGSAAVSGPASSRRSPASCSRPGWVVSPRSSWSFLYLGPSCASRRSVLIVSFAVRSLYRHRSTHWATEATMRRRQWGSSRS